MSGSSVVTLDPLNSFFLATVSHLVPGIRPSALQGSHHAVKEASGAPIIK